MAFIFAKNRLSKAVLICSGHSDGLLDSLIKDNPSYMLPINNRPLIEHTIEFLKSRGIKSISVTVPKSSGLNMEEFLGNLRQAVNNDIEINCIEEEKPAGSAGILRGLNGISGDESFLVIGGNIFIHDIALEDVFFEHANRKAMLTVGVVKKRKFPADGISLEKDFSVKAFSAIHPSRERRSPYAPLDFYIFDAKALKYIKDSGYFDIKEQLIPALKAAGAQVYASDLRGDVRAVNTVEDYFEVQRDVLINGDFSKGRLVEVSENVWVGENVTISPRAYIVGPAIIGRNSSVADHAQILGPAVIGDDSLIGKRALVRESILWSEAELQENASLSYCIMGNGVKAYAGDSFNNRIVVGGLNSGERSLITSKIEFNGIIESVALKMSGFNYRAYLALKRIMDIVLSLAFLVFMSPLFLALYIAIKLDSQGPATFRQKRCGRHGRDFTMLKFRTMVRDAHAMQARLVEQKNVDGPMFKLHDDPRITRVGSFLRKTSLDELPQLVNVLKGEMSLVGPRPLVMDEMKFSPSWRSIRLKVKPGITGMWQVAGRSEAPFHDWIRHDVYYVRNQSLWLDIKILLKTIKVVLNKVGAY